jgi:hypothetical protein
VRGRQQVCRFTTFGRALLNSCSFKIKITRERILQLIEVRLVEVIILVPKGQQVLHAFTDTSLGLLRDRWQQIQQKRVQTQRNICQDLRIRLVVCSMMQNIAHDIEHV